MNNEKIRQLEAERDALLRNWKPQRENAGHRKKPRRHRATWLGKLNGWFKTQVPWGR